MSYILLIVGFICLIKGADYFVDGAASVAYRYHVSPTIVGLTIVALGTSLPELSVSVTAAIQGSNELAVSNVTGSNLFNTLVVVGCSAMLAPFVVPKEVIKRDLPVNILCSSILLAFALLGRLYRWCGLVFLVLLVVYIWKLIKDVRDNHIQEMEEEEEKILPLWKSIVFILGGAVVIMLGGTITVDAAKVIAASLGMSETLIGLTVVSVGTSLPELVTSVVAARKGESGLSLGNAIGSNIMNILFILGLSSLLHPIGILPENLLDICILLCVAVGVYLLVRFQPKMDRAKGLMMVLVYCCYLVWIIMR